MSSCALWALLLCVAVCEAQAVSDVFSNPMWGQQPDICLPAPLGGVDWIIHVREPDYGWQEHTHRANIALAVHGWKGNPEDMTKMELQLEEEIIKSLIRNDTSLIHENDLALFIHALIATQRNPRNFHGKDLVADLLHRVNKDDNVHPFLVLALCNSHAVKFEHLEKIKKYTEHRETNGTLKTREAEMKALALKAMACAASLPNAQSEQLNKFGTAMDAAAKCLIANQVNGIFGNAYTTSLAVQALTAYGSGTWNRDRSLQFLRNESEINVNIIKAYYIELALNCGRVKFIKDLYVGSYSPELPKDELGNYVTYTIKDEQNPDIYFSVIMKIPINWNFFQLMNKAAGLSNQFNFSSYLNQKQEPMVFQVIGKPNDAEENMFWMICRQNDIDHDRHTSNITTFADSPVNLHPLKHEHIMLWYRNSDCPKT